MPISFPELPYTKNALEPHISERTIEFHYGKHHQAYVNNVNNLIARTEYESLLLEEIIKTTAGKSDKDSYSVRAIKLLRLFTSA